MSSEYLESRIYELFESHLEHRPFHLQRLAAVCTGVLLAGTTELSKVARWNTQTLPTSQSHSVSETFFDVALLQSGGSLLSAGQPSFTRIQGPNLAYHHGSDKLGAASTGFVDGIAVVS